MIRIRTRTKPPDLAKVITDAPRLAKGPMTEASAVYLVGNRRRGLKHYAPYKHITRKQAGYQTSDKMRRYLFAVGIWRSSAFGGVAVRKHHRTYAISEGWRIKKTRTKTTITNDVPGVDYLMGDNKQARMNAMIGHRKTSQVATDNTAGMVQAAEQALARYLKQKGLT